MKGMLFYSSLFILLISIHTTAQRYTGDLTLSTQAEIDNFNYTEVKGSLTIKEAEPGAITNLRGLKSLKEVLYTRTSGMGFIEGGNFTIDSNAVLDNFDGLENLTTVWGYFTIAHNASMKNIDTLPNFRGSRWLVITDNPVLEAIDGISGITALSTFNISNNPKLKNIDGLSNLQYLSTSDYWWAFSYISGNASLTNIDGLSNVTSIEYYFEISNNPLLTNIDGLSHLTDGSELQLYIFNNDALTNIDGLSSLSFLPELKIYENASLRDFCGLYNLISKYTIPVAQNYISIYSNAIVTSLQQILYDGPCTEGRFVRLINFRNGGDIREGSTIILNWETNIPYIKLEYRYDGSDEWITIADRIRSADNEYSWNVPKMESYQRIYLRASYSDNPDIHDITTSWISINKVTLNIKNPEGGEYYSTGENITVNWHSSNAYKFKLQYTINGGGSWLFLADNITDSSYVWTAPDIISNHIMVRLLEQDLTGISDSSGEFSITEVCDNQSVKLSGSQQENIVINTGNSIDNYLNTNQFTLTAWIKLDSLNRTMPVINKIAGGFGHFFWLNIKSSFLKFGYSYGVYGTNVQSEINAPVNIIPKKWYHIAAVRDDRPEKRFLKLYLDGVLLDSAETAGFNSIFNDMPIVIGNDRHYTGSNNYSFTGQISEVQMYDVALDADKIKHEMFSQPDSHNANLTGYWKLNGNGKDFSDNHNDGDIHGNPAWTCDHPFLPFVADDDTLAWKIQIKGRTGNLSDETNFAGVSVYATDNYDPQYESPAPPAPPINFIRVYFPHPEWNNNLGRAFTNDIRSTYNLKDTLKIWLFEVQSNIQDTVTLNFVKFNLPESAGMYFSDRSTTEKNIELPSAYKYFNTSSEPKRFMLIIGDTTLQSFSVVKLLQPNGGEIWRSGTAKVIKWKLPPDLSPDSIFIYSTSNDIDYNLIGKTDGESNEFTWNTPNEYWNNSYKIKIISVDSSDTSTDYSDGTFTIVGDSLSKKSKAGFSLISIPVNDSAKTSIFEDDILHTSYYIFSYSPNEGYQTPEFLRYGNGYWLTLEYEWTWDVKGDVLEDDSTKIELRQGYNLIGNRYVRDLRKYKDLSFQYNGSYFNYESAVSNEIITPNLYGTSGRFYYSTEIIAPFEGYWIGVIKSGVKLIEHLPLIYKNSEAQTDSISSKENWQVPIAVYSGDLSDTSNLFGVRSDATNDYDGKYDSPEPPSKPGSSFLNLWFDIPGNKYAEFFGDKFSQDFKSSQNINFTFFIECSEDRKVQLKWDNSFITKIPGVQLTIKDKAGNTTLNMLELNEYSFQYTGLREFIVSGSTPTSIVSNDIPEMFSLSQNYPNPFNPATVITYALPEESYVEIKIYNTIGQLVKIMENSTKSAGHYSLLLEASDLAAGIYIYSMHAKASGGDKEFHDIKKLLLLK